MKHLIREPFLHFVVLGALLFGGYSLVSDRGGTGDDEIVVSAGKVEHLAALFARTWQRPPTRAELEGLIDDYVREEVAYREGMAVGLDRDDTIMRRRVRQKLEFVAEDLVRQVEPTDEELAAYLAGHADAFRVEPRLWFRQVYLSPEQRGDAAAAAAARELLVVLEGATPVDASVLGDRTLLDHGYADASLRDIGGLFGPSFAAALDGLTPGAWHGPIRSGYGLHVVIVDERRDGRLPDLDEVRAEVRREWENERRLEAIDSFYRNLLERYEVTVEWPEPAATEVAP